MICDPAASLRGPTVFERPKSFGMLSIRAGIRIMQVRQTIALLCGLAATCGAALAAQEFSVVRVTSVPGYAIDQLKPNTIIFNDQRTDDTSSNAFIRFDDWARLKPVQKQYLSLYPTYTEPMVHKTIEGVTRTYRDEMQLYVVEARFKLARPAGSIDLKRYTTLPFIENLDPAIKHQLIKPSETTPLTEEKFANNVNPERKWCEGPSVTICVRSHYKLEGKLPIGIALANKIREGEKKIFPYIDFESELRLLTPSEEDATGMKKLTGLETPISGVIEQNMFYVNQVMRFGKLLAVFQQNPGDANSTVATVMIAVAVSSSTLDTKKKYQDVPVLKNLVPVQVLMGNSSFNTGNSISAGLPTYVRNRIKAMAGILDHE
jgi:hypothetical protein